MDLDALERLAKLRDSGTITEAEFIEQKQLLAENKSLDRNHRTGPRKAIFLHNGRNWIGAGAVTVAALVVLFGASRIGMFGDAPPVISSVEQQCRVSISSTLINPETAEFFEFIPVSTSSYIAEFERQVRASMESTVADMNVGSGLYGAYAQGMASSTELIISRHVSEAVSAERTRISNPNIKTYSYRMKADGRLGNTITSTQYCLVDANSCSCLG